MEIEKFIIGLNSAIKKTSLITKRNIDELRPFICNGSPIECDIFLIGINPASNVSWIPYWDKSKGLFDKAKWFKTYKKERIEKKIKAGKLRPRAVSTTRKRIELVLNELKPYKCLETNIYSFPTSNASKLSTIDKNTIIFEYLLNSIRPRVLYIHGEETITFFESKYNFRIFKEKSILIDIGYGEIIIYATSHFSSRGKGMTDSKIKEWGKTVKNIIDNFNE